MKQKVVVRFCAKRSKSRSEALTIAIGVPGVTSATLKGQDKDEMEVVGEGIDAVELTTLLRKDAVVLKRWWGLRRQSDGRRSAAGDRPPPPPPPFSLSRRP
ncbi:disease resistance protein RGA5-like [Diospyros lotus]|uniref:disease resistance protein RGA5-like n=1 Tax=Diospyros lotus TaxID=55363 RepID=UPI002256F5D4|nr:disease resistance protein RGA5-like [Diospyros lotus]